MRGTSIGEFEELCLLAVGITGQDAYGVSIKKELERRTGRSITISTVHSTLARLEKKGFVTSRMGGATQARGGRAKRLFELTAYGKHVINRTRDIRNAMWHDIPKLIWQ